MIAPEILSQIPMFADLDENNLVAIGALARVRTYERGECVFREGEAQPPYFHVLLTGSLQILKCSLSGKETAIRLIGPGEPFGWASLLDTGVAPASARAMTPVRVLKIPRDELMTMLAGHPKVGMRLLATLAERLRDVHEQLHAVVSERARTRLARLIQRYHRREGDILQTLLPHQVLARMAGITYEESVRIIGEWTNGSSPLLQYGRGGKIVVLDAEGLGILAEGDESATSKVSC